MRRQYKFCVQDLCLALLAHERPDKPADCSMRWHRLWIRAKVRYLHLFYASVEIFDYLWSLCCRWIGELIDFVNLKYRMIIAKIHYKFGISHVSSLFGMNDYFRLLISFLSEYMFELSLRSPWEICSLSKWIYAHIFVLLRSQINTVWANVLPQNQVIGICIKRSTFYNRHFQKHFLRNVLGFWIYHNLSQWWPIYT